MITSLGAEAVERAQAIARQADIIAALTLEVLKGTTKAFDSGELRGSSHDWREVLIYSLSLFCICSALGAGPEDIHLLRPHPGQIEVALRFRSLLDSDHHPSQIAGQRTNSKTNKSHMLKSSLFSSFTH